MPELLEIIGENKSFTIHCDYGFFFTLTVDILDDQIIEKLKIYKGFLASSTSLIKLDYKTVDNSVGKLNITCIIGQSNE